MLASPDIKVSLPKWTPKQSIIAASPAKRKILVAGRRFGKTTLFSRVACDAFLQGKRVLEAAPVAKQTNAFWTRTKRYLRPLTDSGVAKKWDTDRVIEMGEGHIQAQTAFDADTLRGDWADVLLLDEYSFMDESAWTVVGAPMLLDKDGEAWFAFTPNRRNHAFRLYSQAISDESGTWAYIHGTSYDNPHLSAEALENITSDMTEDMIQQEIMAEFLEDQGAVFRNIGACMNAPETTPEEHQGHSIVAGLDWGKQNDSTATSIGCADCKVEIAKDRFNKIDYHFQYKRIEELWRHWEVGNAQVELNSIGEPGFEALERAGLPVVAFDTTAVSKPPLIENLSLIFQRAEWQFQPDRLWTTELEAYERKVNPNTGRSSYSAPDGCHDDTVIARALMTWAGSNRPWLIA